MILRGTVAPAASLRWPFSMSCEISVLISISSPGLTLAGRRTRGVGLVAMCKSLACFFYVLAAAAADGDLHIALGRVEFAVTHLGDADDVLGLRQPHPRR